ncbi:MAG: hypothetical protein COY40_03970 [Alphaproteobacteria bacterium CG_4_10_14_0_8_um_filter_53_9]|nr:MAG: hypothetical protein COY40_03970 [Alphaproteobacteria bacterium CG_4_10_14_0_8_um_filter_53_9]
MQPYTSAPTPRQALSTLKIIPSTQCNAPATPTSASKTQPLDFYHPKGYVTFHGAWYCVPLFAHITFYHQPHAGQKPCQLGDYPED